MADEGVRWIDIRRSPDIATVRRVVAKAMDGLGASPVRRTRLVTAASELARNALVHGGGGRMEIEIWSGGERSVGGRRGVGVVLTFKDEGPGIPDIEAALRDGFTTGDGLGKGLGGARRLCDSFEISSAPGSGTMVRVASWLKPPS